MASGIGLPGLREKNGYRLKVFLNQFVSDEEMIFLDKSGGKGEWRRIAKLELYDLNSTIHIFTFYYIGLIMAIFVYWLLPMIPSKPSLLKAMNFSSQRYPMPNKNR